MRILLFPLLLALFLLSIMALSPSFFFSWTLIFVVVASYLGGKKTLFFSFLLAVGLLKWSQPAYLQDWKQLLLMGICFNTSCMAFWIRESFVEFGKRARDWKEEGERMKEEFAAQKRSSDLTFIEEDVDQAALIQMISSLQRRCERLEEEVVLLEQLVAKVQGGSREEPLKKQTRKRKVKEEKGQIFLPF